MRSQAMEEGFEFLAKDLGLLGTNSLCADIEELHVTPRSE